MDIGKMKSLSFDRMLDIDEAVACAADIRTLANEYEMLDLPVPEWLSKLNDGLREEIARRTRAAQMAELKRLETEIEGYKTPGERKTEAQRKLGDLQVKLGLGKPRAATRR
jgi:hypothetical protein